MTRHRSSGRGSHTPPAGLSVALAPVGGSHRAPDAVTRVTAVSRPTAVSRSAARHRSHGRSALRHGVLAVGITGTALAAVAPGSLHLPAEAAAPATLALSAQGGDLPAATTARVNPVTDATSSAGSSGSAGASSSTAASSDLLKATDRVRRPAAPVAAPAVTVDDEADDPQPGGASLDCGASGSYGGVASSVRKVGNALECVFPGHDLLGVGSRGNASDHPSGYALDVMTTDGDQIASCVLKNKDALDVSYVIWNQRINMGSGWKGMEDRGGTTANHKDHVHISFEHGGSPDVSVLSSCG